MILKSIEYSQFSKSPEEWCLDKFSLGQINLLVGKNATGKTRTLNIINGLARLVSGEDKLVYSSGDYSLSFDNQGKSVNYFLSYEDAKVSKEELIINGKSLLERGNGGQGKIYAEQLETYMNFQSPENELACVARRDSVQHSFFEDLFQWGKSEYHYLFGSQLGQDKYVVFSKDDKNISINQKNTKEVVKLFKKGQNEYGDPFINSIKDDMNLLGYKLNDIGVEPVHGIIIKGPTLPENIMGIYIEEEDLQHKTYQHEISQGMFRALSLIIQMNLSHLENTPSLVLIDDIGEGLDFDRSIQLLNLIINKVKKTNIQLIMSTNDRFVMNNVPLEYWLVIQRFGNKCKLFNYANAKKIFDDFKFTGLSNFDFLSSEFYLNGFNKE